MIQLTDLWKEYDGRPVLRGVHLAVRAGERVALVGPNGSGKTTLMRCLTGLVQARGTVRIDGHDPWAAHAESQARVAYVPQRAPALQAPIAEVVAFWARQRARPEAELLDRCGAFGLDLGSVWRQRFSALSGGMQQKLLAAMALASGCPVLLCDEPTANLDPAGRRVFLDGLAERRPPPTLVLSSHRLEEVRALVDRVVVLDNGTVIFDAPLATFLADPARAEAAGLDARPGLGLVPRSPP